MSLCSNQDPFASALAALWRHRACVPLSGFTRHAEEKSARSRLVFQTKCLARPPRPSRLPSLYLLSQILIGDPHKRLYERWFTDIKRYRPPHLARTFQEGLKFRKIFQNYLVDDRYLETDTCIDTPKYKYRGASKTNCWSNLEFCPKVSLQI